MFYRIKLDLWGFPKSRKYRPMASILKRIPVSQLRLCHQQLSRQTLCWNNASEIDKKSRTSLISILKEDPRLRAYKPMQTHQLKDPANH